MHPRIKIRQAIYDRLKQHEQLNELFNARTAFTTEDLMPFCNVMTGSETSESISDYLQEERTLKVDVELYARHEYGIVDCLDELAEVVEHLLAGDAWISHIVKSFRYTGCTPYYDNAEDREAAMLSLNYECQYIWQPEIDAVDLLSVKVGIDMASPRNDPQIPTGPDGQIDAEVDIQLN